MANMPASVQMLRMSALLKLSVSFLGTMRLQDLEKWVWKNGPFPLQMSHEKTRITFHFTGCLTGIPKFL